jgi:hypothetical protein
MERKRRHRPLGCPTWKRGVMALGSRAGERPVTTQQQLLSDPSFDQP